MANSDIYDVAYLCITRFFVQSMLRFLISHKIVENGFYLLILKWIAHFLVESALVLLHKMREDLGYILQDCLDMISFKLVLFD